jgi:uncharacterized protein YggE
MRTSVILSFIFVLNFHFQLHSQISGNEAYRSKSGYMPNKSLDSQKLYIDDNSFIIKAKVLVNVVADSYVAIFGLSEESISLEDCNNKIEKRISGFKSSLRKIGIPEDNIYTDMTTQNKIYDYKIDGKVAEEYLQGFEIKKNVIIQFKNIKDLEEMLILATDFQIYDLVTVEYLVSDINKIYTQLFQSATEVINQKKILYISATGVKLSNVSQIYGENFYSYSPNELYDSYIAYETGKVDRYYNSDYTIKNVRKNKTFYYNKIDYSGFDKVINANEIEPAIEYVMELTIKYDIEK